MTIGVPSPLSDEVEALVHQVIGCCIRVHRALGPELLEDIVPALPDGLRRVVL